MKKRLIFDYIKACVNLYGIVSVEEVVRIYNLHEEDQIDASSIAVVMETKTLKNSFMVFQEDKFISKELIKYDHVAYMLGEQRGKPTYLPIQEELLRYKDPDYIEERSQYLELRQFMAKEFGLDQSLAKDLCEEFHVLSFSHARMQEYFEELTVWGIEMESEVQLKRFVDMLTLMINHTRTWTNKGHTSSEMYNLLSEQTVNVAKVEQSPKRVVSPTAKPVRMQGATQTKKTVLGRNEMCSCGSGKKYKKCCGAN